LEKLDKILRPALAKKGLLKVATSAEVCFYASKWKNARFIPISFARGALKVSVTSSSAASELQMQSEDLLEFINRKFSKKIVRSLRIMNYY
jgi:predicted nucleic acid-binding Zn ribbon protein